MHGSLVQICAMLLPKLVSLWYLVILAGSMKLKGNLLVLAISKNRLLH